MYLYNVCGRCRSRYSPAASKAALAGATALVVITHVPDGNTIAVVDAVAAINVTIAAAVAVAGLL